MARGPFQLQQGEWFGPPLYEERGGAQRIQQGEQPGAQFPAVEVRVVDAAKQQVGGEGGCPVLGGLEFLEPAGVAERDDVDIPFAEGGKGADPRHVVMAEVGQDPNQGVSRTPIAGSGWLIEAGAVSARLNPV